MKAVPQEQVIRQLVESDQTGDPDYVEGLIEVVEEHDDWVLGEVDPEDPGIDFNLHPAKAVEGYYGDDSPVVIAGGFVIDGSHRASAAYHSGTDLRAYIPESETEAGA